jgi:hypothetical protein
LLSSNSNTRSFIPFSSRNTSNHSSKSTLLVFSSSYHYHKTKGIIPLGFNLNLDLAWTLSDLDGKIFAAYSTIKNIFEENQAELRQYHDFKLILLTEQGAGLSQKNIKFEYQFDPTTNDLQFMIKNMLFNLFTHQKMFAIIQADGENLLLIDINKIYGPEYITESDYIDEYKFQDPFLWEEISGLTRAKYNSYMSEFSQHISPEDIRTFLHFHSDDIYTDIMNKFDTLFSRHRITGGAIARWIEPYY